MEKALRAVSSSSFHDLQNAFPVEVVGAKECGLSLRATVTKGLEGTCRGQRILGLVGLGESQEVQFNMNQCFDDRIAHLNGRLERGESLLDSSTASMDCIKQSILVVAPAIGLAKYNSSIAGMTVPAGVNLTSPEMRTRVQTQVRSCFERSLSSIPSMNELSTSLEQITANCTLSLYQELVPSIVQDVLRIKVAANFTDEYEKRRVLNALDGRFRKQVTAQTDPAAIIALIDSFTLEATFYVLEEALKTSVRSAVPVDSRAFADTLLTTVLPSPTRGHNPSCQLKK